MTAFLTPNPRTYTLHIDGVDYGVARLGSGMFTVAYTDGRTVFLSVKDGCFDKDMMSELHRDNPSPFFPAIEKMGEIGDRNLYQCPLYAKLRANYPEAWATSKLIKLAHDLTRKTSRLRSDYDGYEFNRAVVEKAGELAAGRSDIQPGAVEALSDLVNWAVSYGSEYWLDVSIPNFAINCGQLVYLDLMANAVDISKRRHR